MQVVTDTPSAVAAVPLVLANGATAPESSYAQHKIIRRNGAVVGFEPAKISIAMTKAFIAVNGGTGRGVGARARAWSRKLTEGVVDALMRRQPSGGTFHIEDIQDQVELALMRSGEHEVARAYVLYREERTKERAQAARSAGRRTVAAQPVHQRHREAATSRPLDLATRRRARAARRAKDWAREVDAELDHAGDAERPVRRRADG